MLCRLRTRILGPSNRALLSRIEAFGPDSDASGVLIERLDATMRYVAEKTSRDAEERIVQRVERLLAAVSPVDPNPSSNPPGHQLDSVLAAIERLDERMTEIGASVDALRDALESSARQRADGGPRPAADNPEDLGR
jgi:hypothetical protein